MIIVTFVKKYGAELSEYVNNSIKRSLNVSTETTDSIILKTHKNDPNTLHIMFLWSGGLKQ